MSCKKFTCVREGLKIGGIIIYPKKFKKNSKYPLVIVSHGFMGNYLGTKKYAQKFAEMGYVSIAYDFNGGSIKNKSQGKTTDMSVLTEKKDLKAVIDAACNLSFIDQDNINLVGCSQGGFVSALVAKDLQEKIKNLILFYPALCIPDDARRGKMILAEFDPENVPETIMCGEMKLGRQFVTDVNKMNVYDEIKDYKGRVLLIHGTADDLVKPEYSENAYKAYLTSHGNAPSKDLQLVMIDGGNHGFWGPEATNWDKYAFFAIKKFLEGKEQIINVDVVLTDYEEKLEGKKKTAKLFFKGHAQSPYFTGDVETPAFDQQIHLGKITQSCCADYTVKGKDFTGQECYIKIKNQMTGTGKKLDWNTDWKPTVSTDSSALSKLNTHACETYAEMRKQGPMIHIWG